MINELWFPTKIIIKLLYYQLNECGGKTHRSSLFLKNNTTNPGILTQILKINTNEQHPQIPAKPDPHSRKAYTQKRLGINTFFA